MKLLVAAEDKNLDAKLSKVFGHAKYHLLVDTKTSQFTFFDGMVESMPAHGVRRFSDELGIEGVVSMNFGPHAFEDIRNRGWHVFVVRNANVEQAIQKVETGECTPADQPTMKRSRHDHHHHQLHHEQGKGHKDETHAGISSALESFAKEGLSAFSGSGASGGRHGKGQGGGKGHGGGRGRGRGNGRGRR